MAITLQRSGVGSLAYPFYLADYAADAFPTPSPTDSDATLFVLETRQTYVWRAASQSWKLLSDVGIQADPSARTSSVSEWQIRLDMWVLRELRGIRELLAQQAGQTSLTFDPIPEVPGAFNQ